MGKKDEIAKKESGAMIAASLIEESAGAGFDTMSVDDMALPFLTILQSNSPQCDRTKDAYREDCEAGMFFDTVAEIPYPGFSDEGHFLEVVPCFYIKNVLEWKPKREGLAGVHPADTDLVKNTTLNEKGQMVLGNGNILTPTAQYFILYREPEGTWRPAALGMASTSLTKSRKWNTKMNSLKLEGKNGPFTPPMFSHIYKFSTEIKSNAEGSWFTWRIELDRIIEDEELFLAAKKLHEDSRKGLVRAKHESSQDINSENEPPF